MDSHPRTAWNRPAIPLLLAFVAGILAGRIWPDWVLVFLLAAGLTLLVLLIRCLRRRPASLMPLFLFFSLGALSLQHWQHPNFPPNHLRSLTARAFKTRLTGIIVTEPVWKKGRLRFILQAKSEQGAGQPSPAVGRIRVTVAGHWPRLDLGDRIQLQGRIRPIRNFHNPGGFDYEQYMAFQDVWTRIYTRGNRVRVIARQQASWMDQWIQTIRNRIHKHLKQALSQEPLAVMQALLLGNRDAVSPALRKAFTRAGISHILAISGLHIGMIATAAFFLFTNLFSHFPLFLRNGWVTKATALLSLLPVLFYGALSGWSPSTQRAVVMVVVFLLTFLVGKEQDLINTICLAALFILTIHPPALFSISFQLSFAAVLWIVAGLACLGHTGSKPAGIGRRIFQKIRLFFLVSLCATLGTAPLVLHHFNQISLVGLLTNCIAIPAIGFLVLPLGFMAILLLPFWAGASSILLAGCGLVLHMVLPVFHRLAALPFSAIQTVTPSLLEIFCLYTLTGCLLYRIGIYRREKQAETPFKANTIYFRFVLYLALGLMGVDAGYWIHTRLLHTDLRIHILDVGQANAAVLEFPQGYTMMIDGGGFSDNRIFDMGERVIAPFLWDRKIRSVDTLVLSHPNSDHMNGLIFIAQNFHVKEFWSTGERAQTYSYRELEKTLLANNIRHRTLTQLPKVMEIHGVRLELLHPLPGTVETTAGDPNNNSLVIKVSFQGRSILFPGDVMAAGETAILKRQPKRLRSDILIAPHHGSRTSSSTAFLEAVAPRFILISCGWKNRFRMPHLEVLARYTELGCRVLRTDQQGYIRIRFQNQNMTVQTK